MGRLAHRRIASKSCIPDDGFDKILRQQCRDGTAKLAAALLDAGYLVPALSTPVEADAQTPSQPEGEPLPEPIPSPQNSKFTLSLIKTIGRGLVPGAFKDWSGPGEIVRDVARAHNLTLIQMRGKSRAKNLVLARQEAAYRLRTELGCSFPFIARMIGVSDHTTVIHACKRHGARINAA